jgi:hypothetical protein
MIENGDTFRGHGNGFFRSYVAQAIFFYPGSLAQLRKVDTLKNAGPEQKF